MSGLAFAQAPSPSLPLRFLCSSLAWGLCAGLWLIVCGASALASRWAPPTLVLVHMFTLGVLGNAMVGSLLQFLPVAVGSPIPGAALAPWLHGLLNAGLPCLLLAFHFHHPLLSAAAVLLLVPALAAFAIAALSAILRGAGARAPRAGIGMALCALLGTLGLGVALLAVLAGRVGWPLDRLADLHAAFGVAGWAMALLASVGSITVPMFQGTRGIPGRWLLAWLFLLMAVLAALAFDGLRGAALRAMPALALPALLFAAAIVLLQWRAPHRRNPGLRRFWSSGCLALLLACLAGLAPAGLVGARMPLLVGGLVIGVALPLFILGMLLEIIGFLAWIALRRRHPRGVRVPGVDRLFPEPSKQRLLCLHLLAAAGLCIALLTPSAARGAGIALALAHAATLILVLRGWRQALAFQPAGGTGST